MAEDNEDHLFIPIAAKWLASGPHDGDDELTSMVLVSRAHDVTRWHSKVKHTQDQSIRLILSKALQYNLLV